MRIRERPGARRAVAVAVLAVVLPIVATALAVLLIRFAPGGGTPGGTAGEATREVPDGEAAAGGAPVRAIGTRAVGPVTPRRVTRPEGPPDRPPVAKPEADREAEQDERPEISAREAIMALREAGEHGGIAAFPLPGTVPLKAGVLVPEGFELPEGYVRHYQVTDDGQRLPAILMVHPDYELVGADGKPVAAPGGVVPPELAPPGMPIEMLEVPEQPGASGAVH